jgi:P4 family phage/plasmid primase-like protien
MCRFKTEFIMPDLSQWSVSALAEMKRSGSAAEKAAVNEEIRRRISGGDNVNRLERLPLHPVPMQPPVTSDIIVERAPRAEGRDVLADRSEGTIVDVALIKARYFTGKRSLRGFRAVRIRDDKTEVEHHLFDNEATAFAWVTESLRLGFDVHTDTEEAVEFMRHWPTERMHVWAKVPDGKIEARSFDRNDAGYTAIHEWIEQRQGRSNLYFVVNDIAPEIILGVSTRGIDPKTGKPKVILKPKETDMVRMVAAHVDSDYRVLLSRDEADRSAHHQAEFNRIVGGFENHEPRFNVVTFTGGGGQAFHLFRQPISLEGDTTKIFEAKRINIHLKRTFDGSDDCESLDHVMRLPFTINIPDEKKRKRGRTPALSYCVRFDEPDRWHDITTNPIRSGLAPHQSPAMDVSGANNAGQEDEGAGSITVDQLKELLAALDVSAFRDGPRWRALLWACHHATKGEGCEVFVEWSASDPEFANDKGHTRAAWDRAKDDRENGITVATLFHELKQAGRDDLIQKFKPVRRKLLFLEIGSDVEIAERVHKDLLKHFDEIVHAEGSFWRYATTHWEPIDNNEVRLAVHLYDGARYLTAAGEPGNVKLGKGRIDSVLNECATLCANAEFFDKRPVGINCATGFIHFDRDGNPAIEPHNRNHRCRHTLPGRWQVGASSLPPTNSLLHRLLDGCFKSDLEADAKVTLLSEVCGAAALGYATKLKQPRALILFGQTAENGKSQILDLARGLLPANAVCSLPAGKMGDERHIIGLVNKLLNASDELSATAIASDAFKAVVTGEPVEGRDVYKSRVEFRSMAQNLFATNNLPPFLGGMDRGVQRRLLVVPFNRTIPMGDRIENIGRRIATEEADLLLAWAVEGASRLVRQRNFTVPPSCKQALNDWIFGADPVLAWISECVQARPVVEGRPAISTRDAYTQFHTWAVAEGFKTDKLPAINGFTQRVLANAPGIEHHRTAQGRLFLGLMIKGSTRTKDAALPF